MSSPKRFLILIFMFAFAQQLLSQDLKLTSGAADRESLALYESGEWKALLAYCNHAISDSVDGYEIRYRAGQACYHLKKYMKAVLHFNEALAFCAGDPLAEEYLFNSYLELDRFEDARRVLEQLPEEQREAFRKRLSHHYRVKGETGPLFSNEMAKTDTLDLDGTDNLYGEADITQDGYCINAGVARDFNGGFGLCIEYTYVKLNKNKMVQAGDSLAADDLYPLTQNQLYASGMIPVGKNYTVLPAFHYTTERYTTIAPRLSPDSAGYIFPVEMFIAGSWIGYLSITRDLRIIRASVFGAFSDLNDKNQYQGGFQVVAYPLGNLKFYTSTKLLDHINDGDHNFIFEQVAGGRIYRRLWAEISATLGNMENYHENNAAVVYNLAERITFKSGAKLIYSFDPRWTVNAEYLYFKRAGQYVQYIQGEGDSIVKTDKEMDFNNQVVLLGLTFNF